MLIVIMLIVIMLIVIMLIVIMLGIVLSVIVLGVVTLSVITRSVALLLVMLNVVVPSVILLSVVARRRWQCTHHFLASTLNKTCEHLLQNFLTQSHMKLAYFLHAKYIRPSPIFTGEISNLS
jgi:hypothetical protein